MDLKKELNAVTESVRQQVPAEMFATMEAANRKLASSDVARLALARGQRIPDFELPDVSGKMIKSSELLAKGPLVMVFYRGHWCPYCNLDLKALQERVADIQAKGATLVAISPQTPDQSLTTSEKHALRFPVLSDVGNRVARQFNLTYTLDESLKPIYEQFDIHIEKHNGDNKFELPLAATYVISRNGTVAEVYLNVDYRERVEPDTILECLDKVI